MKKRLLEFATLLSNEEIARRYFIMNSFDGALTVFGIIIALYFSGIENASVVIVSCVGAAVSMCVSGIWGAYAADRAERLKKLNDLERHLLHDLDETHVGKKIRTMTLLVALVDGLSPVAASLLIITPFLMSKLGLLDIQTAFHAAILIVAMTLITLGAITSRIAGEKPLPSALKMLLSGVVVAAVSIMLEYFRVI